jgi:chromosome segregation ATPase
MSDNNDSTAISPSAEPSVENASASTSTTSPSPATTEETQQKRGAPKTRGFNKKSRGSNRNQNNDNNSEQQQQENQDGDDEDKQKKQQQKQKKLKPFESAEELQKKITDLKQQKVAKPDDKTSQERVKQLTDSIEKIQEELHNIRTQLEEKDKSLKSTEEEKQHEYNSANEFSEKLKVLFKERDVFQEKIDRLEQERDTLQNQRTQMQADCPFKTVEQVERKMKELNDQLNETREKRKEDILIKQIDKLEISKSMIDKLVDTQDRIDAIKKNIRDIQKEAREKSDEIKKLKDERQKYYDNIDKIKKKKKIIMDQKKVLTTKSQNLRNQVEKNYEEIRHAKKDQAVNSKKFVKQEKDLTYLTDRLQKQKEYEDRKQNAKKKQEEYEKQREERQVRQEIAKKKQEEFNKQWEEYEEARRKNPYENEISMCTNLINYLEQMQKTTNKIIKKEKAESLLGKKTTNKAKANINHPIEKFNAFGHLSLKPPVNYSQISESLQILREKRSYYNKFKIDDENTKIEVSEIAPITIVDATHITGRIPENDEDLEHQEEIQPVHFE